MTLIYHPFAGDPWGPCSRCAHPAHHEIHRDREQEKRDEETVRRLVSIRDVREMTESLEAVKEEFAHGRIDQATMEDYVERILLGEKPPLPPRDPGNRVTR